MSELSWIKDVPEAETLLEGDAKIIVEEFGLPVFTRFYELFLKGRVDCPDSSLNNLREVYIRKYYDGTNARHISRQLGKSISYVQKVVKESYHENKKEED